MVATPQRALLATTLCACALTVGLVIRPQADRARAGNGPLGPREAGVLEAPRAEATAELERPQPRSPALADVLPGADPEADDAVARIALRGRVVLEDGSAAAGARVWSASASARALGDGSFELEVVSTDELCTATLPGFRPPRAAVPCADGMLLKLGPPAQSLAGRIQAEDGVEREGWRIALLDGQLLEPVGLAAPTVESASSLQAPRRQISADGTFAVDGLADRAYTLAAWRAARERIELYAAPPARPGDGPVLIAIPRGGARRTIELRCVAADGAPLANVRAGWPGTPAFATTNVRGELVLHGALPPRLTLVLVRADGTVHVRVVDTSGSADVVL